MKVWYAFRTAAFSTPWVAFDTREDCLVYFLNGGKHHLRHHDHSLGQEKLAKRMSALLGSLELFIEPPVEQPDPGEKVRESVLQERLKEQRAEAAQKLTALFPLFADQIDEVGNGGNP